MSGDKRKRLAVDVIGQLEDDLEANPLDYEKWNKLIKHAIVKDKEEQIQKVFDKYLSIFKYDARQWRSYITYEMNRQDFKKVEALFARCITSIDNVELFRLYVNYVRRVNDVITGGEKARGIVIQAFEFAVNRVGIDIKSGDLWKDYLEFLKTWTPTASWEQQQKVDLIRKVYKRLFLIPTEKIEQLWSVYTKWENEINSSTASRFIAEKSSEFMEARSWNTEWHNVTERLLKRDLLPESIENDHIKYQLSLWYRWLDLESKNHLNIKDEKLLNKRIEYVYKQSIIALPFVPELWYKYNQFCLSNANGDDMNKSFELLSQGLILNPKSYLLSFELSELYERDNNLSSANEVLNNLIMSLIKDHNIVLQRIDSIKNDMDKTTGSNLTSDDPNTDKQNINNTDSNSNNDDDYDDDDDANNNNMTNNAMIQRAKQGYNLSKEDIESLKFLQHSEQELSRSITLVYTKLMMTNKRSSGIKESRQIFKQAKKFSRIGHELYVENALMEYYSDNKNTARKVFELGMKNYGSSGKYLLSYLDFLIMVNEIENIKVLFEVSMTNLLKGIDNPEETEDLDTPHWIKAEQKADIDGRKYYIKKLIKKYGKFATKFLDLGIISSLESRYKELFPEDDPIELLSSRYAYDEINLVNYDLGKPVLDLSLHGDPGFNDQRSGQSVETDSDSKSKKRKVELPSKPILKSDVDTPNNGNTNMDPILQSQQQSQEFISNSIYNLLRILPNASYFGGPENHIFNSKKLVELLNSMDVPN